MTPAALSMCALVPKRASSASPLNFFDETLVATRRMPLRLVITVTITSSSCSGSSRSAERREAGEVSREGR